MLQTNRAVLALALASAALGVTACHSNDLPIGDDGTGQSTLLVAPWEGYVENFQFRSGSDVIRIDITAVQGTTITGTVRFGTGATLPAATDPLVGYPAGPDYDGGYELKLPFEGHDFTMQDAVLTDHRLRFSISPLDLWKGWCEMQTPHVADDSGASYLCSINGYTLSGNTCTAGGVPADCGHSLLCQKTQVCACNAAGCAVNVGEKLDFDVAFDAQEATGSVVGLARQPTNQGGTPPPVSALNVRLTRGN
jgi:hypothetical protein